jgi:protein TonB
MSAIPPRPPFLVALELDDDADERTARRAYAKRLKAIDPEADPEGFQTLREHFDRTLAFIAWRDQRRASMPAQSAPPTPSVEASDASVDAHGKPVDRPLAGPPLPRPDSAPAAPPPPRPQPREAAPDQAQGDAVFADMEPHLARPGADDESLADALRAALHDPRLVNVDSRTWFEWRVARRLAEGWQLGHEHLFLAACRIFGWSTDPRRLRMFNQVGWTIDAAIREKLLVESARSVPMSTIERLLRTLRKGVPANDRDVIAQFGTLRLLAQHAPNWLSVVAPRPRVQEWITRWQALPEAQRQAAEPSPPARAPHRVPPAPQPRSSGGMGIGALVLFGLIAVTNLAKLGTHESWADPALRSNAQPMPATSPMPYQPAGGNPGSPDDLTRGLWDGSARAPVPGTAWSRAAPAPAPAPPIRDTPPVQEAEVIVRQTRALIEAENARRRTSVPVRRPGASTPFDRALDPSPDVLVPMTTPSRQAPASSSGDSGAN